eukprot:1161602-Pelagomonas_calceolata.AAC.6
MVEHVYWANAQSFCVNLDRPPVVMQSLRTGCVVKRKVLLFLTETDPKAVNEGVMGLSSGESTQP